MFECQESTLPIDNHWYLRPICQAVIDGEQCNRPLNEFPHNDIVNEDYMYEKHTFVTPTEPLVWGENAYRFNICRGDNWSYDQDPDEYRKCYCPCHWGQYYVNIYLADRAYGGPEEGGWYYDCGEPVGSIPCDSYGEAVTTRENMEKKYPRTGKRNSVLGGVDYNVVIERHFATAYPEVTPRYE